MSEQKPDSGVDENATQIRQEPNNDKTHVRRDTASERVKGAAETSENPDVPDNADTIIRGPSDPQDSHGSEPNPEQVPTLLREPIESRSEQSRKAESSDTDATILRQPGEEKSDPGATILREPGQAAPKGGATILREPTPKSPGGATILREPGAGNVGGNGGGNATILREPGPSGRESTELRASSTSATILRSGEEMRRSVPQAPDEDSTVIRGNDDDRTVINQPGDDDATVIGGGRGDADTTYIASVGPQTSKGNSEAGRLLKNRFVLEEKIGSGGMGDVYKALDLRQQEAQERNPYIAIKILNDNFARHKDAFISLQREATRTRGIPHPNIMGVYDFDREGDTVFMSMELLDGKPLDDYLKEHPEGVSVEDSWNIIDGICKGLGRAHDAGIVHSDFKPGNIYYTGDKTAKVFDFGIARAVSNPNELEADGEKTVFDAGSLGALTPTYASYEMLKGLEPTKSDDVYAVALVAYELFTGKHPYGRTPADKALEKGLVPEPIPFLKRRHWKALKKGLALKGADRTQSIDEFYAGMFSEDPPYFRYAAIGVILASSIGFGVYQQLYGGEEIPEDFTSDRALIETNLGQLNNRIADGNRNFRSDDYRDQLQLASSRAQLAIIKIQEEWPEYLEEGWAEAKLEDLHTRRIRVMDAYVEEIDKLVQQVQSMSLQDKEQVERALGILDQATAFGEDLKADFNLDPQEVERAVTSVASWNRAFSQQLDKILAEEQRIADEEEARIKREAEEAERLRLEGIRDQNYIANLNQLEIILRCKGDIPDEAFVDGETPEDEPLKVNRLEQLGTVISNLRTIYPERFDIDRPGIVAAVAGCISQRIAVRDPDRARTVKSVVMTYLPAEPVIANIEISDLDPCAARGLEGQGNRNRSWCSDKMFSGGTGPQMVVVPAVNGVSGDKYAISRMEIRVGDYNEFCQATGCQVLPGSISLPATNITLAQAEAYIAWLSDQTGKQYRLPTEKEWFWAARTNRPEPVDDNVNCTVDSRGVRLGDKLLNTLSGRPNNWGLYNYIGNAREWALAEDELVALGGAHTDPKAECSVTKSIAHTGDADPVTGFRIVRQIGSS